MNKVRAFLVAMMMMVGGVAAAQGVAVPSNHIGFTQTGQDPSIAAGAGVTYNYYIGASTTPVVATGLTCILVGVDSQCQVNLPALTPGTYSITLSQVMSGAESPKSLPLSFTFVVVVTPKGLTLKP